MITHALEITVDLTNGLINAHSYIADDILFVIVKRTPSFRTDDNVCATDVMVIELDIADDPGGPENLNLHALFDLTNNRAIGDQALSNERLFNVGGKVPHRLDAEYVSTNQHANVVNRMD